MAASNPLIMSTPSQCDWRRVECPWFNCVKSLTDIDYRILPAYRGSGAGSWCQVMARGAVTDGLVDNAIGPVVARRSRARDGARVWSASA